MARKGMMVGSGKRGYHNIISRDPAVHSASARGIKQPQQVNVIDPHIEWNKENLEIIKQKQKDQESFSKEFITSDEPEPTFDFVKYDYSVSNNDWNFRELYDNKILQENLKGQKIIITRPDYDFGKQYGVFDGVGYSKSEKKYYIAYTLQEKPRGALTGTISGRVFVDNKFNNQLTQKSKKLESD